LQVGDTLNLPFGEVEICESARLHPVNNGMWDSTNTVVEGKDGLRPSDWRVFTEN